MAIQWRAWSGGFCVRCAESGTTERTAAKKNMRRRKTSRLMTKLLAEIMSEESCGNYSGRLPPSPSSVRPLAIPFTEKCRETYPARMWRIAKRIYRRYLPRRWHPLLDGSFYDAPFDDAYGAAYDEVLRSRNAAPDDFVSGRFEEGRRWRGLLNEYVPSGRVRVLDVGGGNGAIELALSADPRFRATSVEMLWNDDFRELSARIGRPMNRVVADARLLPFRNETFDAITCLETLEHLAGPAVAGAELARVSRKGGILLLTTPPRWRYAFGPDPHFGIHGLALLPTALQRRVAARSGFDSEHHYVDRLYGSIRELASVFPLFTVERVLSRSRAPRRWFWDAVILRKQSRRRWLPFRLR